MNILLVEDSRAVGLYLHALLVDMGHRVTLTTTGEEGIALFKRQSFDLVLMDIELPGMSGMEACRRIRRLEKVGDWTPLVFLSAHNNMTMISDCINNGGDDYITKQVDPVMLKLKLHAMGRIASYRAELERLASRLRELSVVDGLTGCANRRGMEEFLEENIQKASYNDTDLTVMMIDVDFFKRYNDHYGHLAGDECLREVATVLQSSFLNSTDCIARYGGEEFIAVMPGTPAQGATLVAERIQESFARRRLEHEGSKLGFVTVSIGICTYDREMRRKCHGVNQENCGTQLIQFGDEALYESKRSGRNCYRVYNEFKAHGQFDESVASSRMAVQGPNVHV